MDVGVIRQHHLAALSELLGDPTQQPTLSVHSSVSVASLPIRWGGATLRWQVFAPWPGEAQGPDVLLEDDHDFEPLATSADSTAEIRQALLDWDPEDEGALLRLLQRLLRAFCVHHLAQLHGVTNDRLQFELSTLPHVPGLEARLLREPGRGQLASFGIPLEALDLSKLAPLLQPGAGPTSRAPAGQGSSQVLSRQHSSGASHTQQGGESGSHSRHSSGSGGGGLGGSSQLARESVGSSRQSSSGEEGISSASGQASAGEPKAEAAPQLQGSSIKLEVTFPLSAMENAVVALRVPQRLRQVLQPEPQPPAWSRQSCLMEYVPLVVERLQQQVDALCTRLFTRQKVVDVLTEVWGQPVDLNPSHLVACWHVAWEGNSVLLLLELGPGFPEEAPLITVESLRHLGGPGHQMMLRKVPWSPRWPAREMAGRIFNHVKEQLPSIVGPASHAM